MLTYIDTLIGFAGIMLLLSMVVTAVVQAAIALFELRGGSLRWGVAMLVKRAAPAKTDADAEAMADGILRHETVSPHRKLATAIRLDELVRIVGEHKQGSEFAQACAAWFDTVMDRTTERFTRWTRYWTIGVAAVLALALQIDSIALLRQISGNPELRARLAQSADATLKLAEEATSKSALASRALREVVKDKPEVKAPVPPSLELRRDGLAWIRAEVKDDAPRADLERAFDDRYDELLRARLPELTGTAVEIKQRLDRTDLVILTVRPWDAWQRWWKQDLGNHLAGVLLTIVFLSLGGPFWYNLLRQLSNLRPLLAGKVEKDDKAPS